MKTIIVFIILILVSAGCDGGSSDGGNSKAQDDNSILGSASIKISGDLDLGTARVDAFFVELESSVFPRHMIEIGDFNQGYMVRILFSGEPTPGTYAIVSELGAAPDADQTFSAGLLYLLSPAPDQQYRVEPQGTVTFDAVGETISGSFEFTATNESGDGNVTVQGAFEQIRKGDAVFEF